MELANALRRIFGDRLDVRALSFEKIRGRWSCMGPGFSAILPTRPPARWRGSAKSPLRRRIPGSLFFITCKGCQPPQCSSFHADLLILIQTVVQDFRIFPNKRFPGFVIP